MTKRDPSGSPFQPGPTRRTVLRAAGLTALAGGGLSGLAACSSDAGLAAPAASTGAATPSAAPSAAASSATPSASPSSSAPAAAPTGPSVAAVDVPVSGGVILEDAKVVVTQPVKGEFKAFSAVCTHRSCIVAEVTGDAIICDCHGSQFSIKDGSVLKSPADQPLAPATASLQGDRVVVQS